MIGMMELREDIRVRNGKTVVAGISGVVGKVMEEIRWREGDNEASRVK
jgi:hypothetical protein